MHSNVLVAVQAAALSGFVSVSVRGQLDWLGMTAVLLLTWQVYTLDRLGRPGEDLAGDRGRLRFVDRHARLLRHILVATLLCELALVWARPFLGWAFVAGGASGVLYLVRIPVLRRRLKEVPYLKSFYVPLVHLGTYLLAVRAFPRASEHGWLIAGVYLLLAFNAIAFDLKDRENDKAFRIRTFANSLSTFTLVRLLQLASMLTAAVLSLQGGALLVLALAQASFALAIDQLLSPLTTRRYFFVVLDGLLAQPLCVFALAHH